MRTFGVRTAGYESREHTLGICLAWGLVDVPPPGRYPERPPVPHSIACAPRDALAIGSLPPTYRASWSLSAKVLDFVQSGGAGPLGAASTGERVAGPHRPLTLTTLSRSLSLSSRDRMALGQVVIRAPGKPPGGAGEIERSAPQGPPRRRASRYDSLTASTPDASRLRPSSVADQTPRLMFSTAPTCFRYVLAQRAR